MDEVRLRLAKQSQQCQQIENRKQKLPELDQAASARRFPGGLMCLLGRRHFCLFVLCFLVSLGHKTSMSAQCFF